MRLKTILNHGLSFKCRSIWNSEFNEKKNSIIVEIKAQTNSKPVCSICGTFLPGYDSLPERLFEFVPMWGQRVFFRYAMRREKSFHQSLCGVSCVLGKRTFLEKRGGAFPYLLAGCLFRCRIGDELWTDASKFRLRNRTGRWWVWPNPSSGMNGYHISGATELLK